MLFKSYFNVSNEFGKVLWVNSRLEEFNSRKDSWLCRPNWIYNGGASRKQTSMFLKIWIFDPDQRRKWAHIDRKHCPNRFPDLIWAHKENCDMKKHWNNWPGQINESKSIDHKDQSWRKQNREESESKMEAAFVFPVLRLRLHRSGLQTQKQLRRDISKAWDCYTSLPTFRSRDRLIIRTI